MLRVVIISGEPAGRVFELRSGVHGVGRSRSAAIRLGAADVSGTHAVIEVGSDGSAEIENRSQFGTRVDGVEISGRVKLVAGQQIEMGGVTALRVEEVGEELLAEMATGAGMVAQEETGVVEDGGFKPLFAEPGESSTGDTFGGDDFSELTRAAPDMTMGGDDDEMATRAMQTRAAAPDELEHLREVERKRGRRRMGVVVGSVALVVVAALIFWPRQPPPELELEWSRDASGRYLDSFEAGPTGGYKDDGYDICYPDNKSFERKAVDGGVLLEGRIGRKLDVPLRIIVVEERDRSFVGMTRSEAVAAWIERQSGRDGRWNFDRPSPTLAFYGRRSGVPYNRVNYLRDAKGSWFGVASITCYGDRVIVARIEVPADERMRAEKMMAVRLIIPSQSFENGHWEGVVGAARVDESDTLRQVRSDLERTAPATWVAVEKLLQAVLTQAVVAGNEEVTGEATALLVRLRERQALYYNSQKLAFEAAMMQNNYIKATRVAEFTKAVFSNESDNRFYDVRKWRAEP